MLPVLVIVSLILTVIALVVGILVLQSLKALEKKLSGVEKHLGQLDGDVKAAELQIKALQAQVQASRPVSDGHHPLISVLGTLIGGNSHRWLPVAAAAGSHLLNVVKARRSQHKSGAKAIKSLPAPAGKE